MAWLGDSWASFRIAFAFLGSAGCLPPPTVFVPPSPPESPASSSERPGVSAEPRDPAKVYAQHLRRAAELEERCKQGAVDLEPFTDTAAYLLQFQAHPVRDAALVGLESCRQLVLDAADVALEESRPARMKLVAESMEEMTQELLEELDLEGEVRATHEGVSITVLVEIPSSAEPIVDADVFETLCTFARVFGAGTLVLIENGEGSECSHPVDESATRESMLEELNVSPPLDPPPAGKQPIPDHRKDH